MCLKSLEWLKISSSFVGESCHAARLKSDRFLGGGAPCGVSVMLDVRWAGCTEKVGYPLVLAFARCDAKSPARACHFRREVVCALRAFITLTLPALPDCGNVINSQASRHSRYTSSAHEAVASSTFSNPSQSLLQSSCPPTAIVQGQRPLAIREIQVDF